MLSTVLSTVLALVPQVATDTLLVDIRTNFDGSTKNTALLEIGTLPDRRVLVQSSNGDFGSGAQQPFRILEGTPGGSSPLQDSSGPLFGLLPYDGQSAGSLVYGPPQGAALPDGRLVFLGDHPAFGVEPYVTDGTPLGTRVLGVFSPEEAPNAGVQRFGDRVVMLSSTLTDRRNVVVTDGTVAGSGFLLTDVLGMPVEPADQVRFGSDGTTLLFTHFVHAQQVTRVLSSDGTQAGTALRATLPVRAGEGIERFVLPGRFCFAGADGLYAFDTATQSVQLLHPGISVRWGAMQGGRLFAAVVAPFNASHDLVVTDGTPAGTSLVRSFQTMWQPNSRGAAVLGGGILFPAAEADFNLEPWFSDGTSAGTQRVLELYPGPISSRPDGFTAFAGEVYFSGTSPIFGREMWRTDGTEAGTQLVRDYAAGTGDTEFARPWLETPAGLLFLRDHPSWGFEPHVTLGTATTTQYLGEFAPEIPGSSKPAQLTRAGDQVFFTAVDNVHGRELWATDGTAAGTRLVRDNRPVFQSSAIEYLTAFGDRVVFIAQPTAGEELWISDGTEAGTYSLGPAFLSIPSNEDYQFDVGETQFFYVSYGNLWRSDGTPEGTYVIEGFGENPVFSPSPHLIGVFDDSAIAMHRSSGGDVPDVGWELYSFDGTPDGHTLLKDFLPGTDSYEKCESVGGATLAALRIEKFSGEVWQGFTDGKPGGTRTPAALGIGGLGLITPHAASDTHVFFGSPSGTYATDGTAAGTELLPPILYPEFKSLGSLVYFAAPSALWRSDGTNAGTYLVQDVQPTHPVYQQVVGLGFAGSEGAYLWADNDPATGREIWITDGAPGTGRQLADSNPGVADGSPSRVLRAGEQLVFAATTPSAGRELHAVSFAATGASLIEEFGTGCSGLGFAHRLSGSGPATLGGALVTSVQDSAPGELSALTYSTSVGALDLGAGCTLFALAPKLLALTPVDGAGQTTNSVALPVDPALAGLRVALQAAITEPAGPFGGAFGLSSGLELILGG